MKTIRDEHLTFEVVVPCDCVEFPNKISLPEAKNLKQLINNLKIIKNKYPKCRIDLCFEKLCKKCNNLTQTIIPATIENLKKYYQEIR